MVTSLRHYIQVPADSISCAEYLRALVTSVKVKFRLDYINFGNILPSESLQVLPFTPSSLLLWKNLI